MRKFNCIEYRRYKKEKLSERKNEHQKFKKILKKTLFQIAQEEIGLELTLSEENKLENYPYGKINYFKTEDK